MSGTPESSAEIAAELARLRRLEDGLRAERERIRAQAAGEVVQLQAALRETAARAAQRDRDVERLTSQLQKATGPDATRRGGLRAGRPQLRRGEPDRTGAAEPAIATFERDRKQLEERARAVAATEIRQRTTEAELAAEALRLAALGDSLGERGRLSSELAAAGKRIAELERQLEEHGRQRRAAEVALLATRARLGEAEGGAGTPTKRDRGGEEEARIAVLLARREDELELARREEVVTRREIELSLTRRRVGDEERRLLERSWRTGGPAQRTRPPAGVNRSHGVTFSEGLRQLADAQGRERPDESG